VTVAEAARQIRTLVVQVSCYESGRTRPRARAVQALAAALEVDVLELEQGRRPVSDAEVTKLATVLAVDADRLRRALPT
jgi:transcriptional regulator with XRE-family HTH domain